MFVKHVLRIECKSVHFDTVDRILNTHRSNNIPPAKVLRRSTEPIIVATFS
jgi:hypothetical protein